MYGPIYGKSITPPVPQWVISVDYATVDDSALTGKDYSRRSGTLSFTPGQTVKNVVVPISNDKAKEGAERFRLRLTNATNASFEVSTKSGDVDGRVMGADGVEKTFGVAGMVRVNEEIGSGSGARITVSTMSGDVKVRQESPVVEIQ